MGVGSIKAVRGMRQNFGADNTIIKIGLFGEMTKYPFSSNELIPVEIRPTKKFKALELHNHRFSVRKRYHIKAGVCCIGWRIDIY